MRAALDDLRPGIGLAPDPATTAVSRSPVLTLAPHATSDSGGEWPPALLRFRDRAPIPATDLPAWGDPAAPLVYVSFGSEAGASHHFPGLYRRAAEALGELPVRTLITIGDRRDPAELGPLPPSVRVERWVPQAAVMPRASAVVAHGGSGSTLTALAAGVPLALVPLFVDGPANARRVAELGAGIALGGRTGGARPRRRRAAVRHRLPGGRASGRGRDPGAAAGGAGGGGTRGGRVPAADPRGGVARPDPHRAVDR